MKPADFAAARAAAIEAYGGWAVLSRGEWRGLGAVAVRDSYGVVGMVVQQHVGASAGWTLVGLEDYTATEA